MLFVSFVLSGFYCQTFQQGNKCGRGRLFSDSELSDADPPGVELGGADSEKFSWLADAHFSGASLRDTSS